MKTPSRKSIKRRQKNLEKKRRQSKEKKKLRNTEKQSFPNLALRLRKTIDHFFPDLYERIREIPDFRKSPEYELVEVIIACLGMFLFKEGSRNALNNERKESRFKKNFTRIFKVRLPHMDTVDKVMRKLEEQELEKLKTEMIRGLIERKIFAKSRLLGKYYLVAVDATHVMTVEEGHCQHCLTRTSKKGKVTYFHNVLEAKLVCNNGFCLSLGTQWIENPQGDYDKQDCEHKAFERLAPKLKQNYPHLPICILGDGLYPNQTFFNICKNNNWGWIVTFKDGNLPSVWKIVLSNGVTPQTRKHTQERQRKNVVHNYTWINNIEYRGNHLHWFECVERVDQTQKRFVFLSNLAVNYEDVMELTISGRLRWKIENEGFNIQKNQGYGLGHKYSRISMKAFKNYYQCMQIAHMINQLFELGSLLKPLLKAKTTIKHLWKMMLAQIHHDSLDSIELEAFLERCIQIRFT
jgi:hypothetical protein